MDDSVRFDLSLRYDTASKCYPAMQKELQRVVKAFEATGKIITSGPAREQASLRNVECLLANIHTMVAQGYSTIALSLSPNTYAGKRVNSGIIRVIKTADAGGYLILVKGFFNRVARRGSRLARIQPTQKLLDLLAERVRLVSDEQEGC